MFLSLCSGNPFRESGPPACMAKLIMMRHKVRKNSHLLAQPVVFSYSPTPPVKPSQHTMSAHFARSTYRTASVHITHATPTGSPMDPHPQTFRSTTPLTQAPLFLSPPNHQTPTNAVSCMHARGLFTTNDDLDNDPRPTSLTPAPPSHLHSHSLDLTHPNLPTSIYALIYPKPIFPPHPTPPYLDPFVYVLLALIFSVEKID
jgi:hypothetical protein